MFEYRAKVPFLHTIHHESAHIPNWSGNSVEAMADSSSSFVLYRKALYIKYAPLLYVISPVILGIISWKSSPSWSQNNIVHDSNKIITVLHVYQN